MCVKEVFCGHLKCERVNRLTKTLLQIYRQSRTTSGRLSYKYSHKSTQLSFIFKDKKKKLKNMIYKMNENRTVFVFKKGGTARDLQRLTHAGN